jgi:hypothetical protein
MINFPTRIWNCSTVNTVKPVHNGLCPQRKPVINGHLVKNTSFFMFFVWNRTCTQRKLSITSEFFPPEQIFVQTNLFTTNFLSTFFCSLLFSLEYSARRCIREGLKFLLLQNFQKCSNSTPTTV